MGMSDVRRAFSEELGGKGTCLDAKMDYLPTERKQRLTFTVSAGGSTEILTEDVPPGVDLVGKAKAMAKAFGE